MWQTAAVDTCDMQVQVQVLYIHHCPMHYMHFYLIISKIKSHSFWQTMNNIECIYVYDTVSWQSRIEENTLLVV